MIQVFGFVGTVSPDLADAVARADLVVGGRRHLDALQVPQDRRVVLGAMEPAIDALRNLGEDQMAVVVASGDPLMFGVVRRLRRAGLTLQVTASPSSVQLAFAAVALPWDDALVVSLHATGNDESLNVCRSHPKVALLTAPGRGINEIAIRLADLPRWYVLAEKLGEPGQRISVLTTEQARTVVAEQPNLVLVLAHHPDDPAALGTNPAIMGHFEGEL